MDDIGLRAFQKALDNAAKQPLKACHWCGHDCLSETYCLEFPEATFCSCACINAAKSHIATS